MRKIILFVTGAVLLLTIPAFAQYAGKSAEKGKWSVAPFGNVSFPMGSLKDFTKTGFGGGLAAEYYVADAFAVGVQGSYNTFSGDPSPLPDWRPWQYGAFGKYVIPTQSKLSPWIKYGAGGYSLTFSKVAGATTTAPSQSRVGWFGGLGVAIEATPTVSVFVEGLYHDALKKHELPVNWVSAGVGVQFLLGMGSTAK